MTVAVVTAAVGPPSTTSSGKNSAKASSVSPLVVPSGVRSAKASTKGTSISNATSGKTVNAQSVATFLALLVTQRFFAAP